MNLDDYRLLFIVITLGLALIFATPLISVLFNLENRLENYSEFWLLGTNHMASDYPFNIGENKEYKIFLGLDNHNGNSEYYMVCVKFSNSTEFLPDVNDTISSNLPCLYEYRFFVSDDAVWESDVSFEFEDIRVEEDTLFVENITFNNVYIPFTASGLWNSEKEGYFFELFFELWHYDVESEGFTFADRLIGLSLNMTAG